MGLRASELVGHGFESAEALLCLSNDVFTHPLVVLFGLAFLQPVAEPRVLRDLPLVVLSGEKAELKGRPNCGSYASVLI